MGHEMFFNSDVSLAYCIAGDLKVRMLFDCACCSGLLPSGAC